MSLSIGNGWWAWIEGRGSVKESSYHMNRAGPCNLSDLKISL